MGLKDAIIERSRLCGIDPYRDPFKPADLGLGASDYGSFSDYCSEDETCSGKWNSEVILTVAAWNSAGKPIKYLLCDNSRSSSVSKRPIPADGEKVRPPKNASGAAIHAQGPVMVVGRLWESRCAGDWRNALDRYWHFVKRENIELERAMDALDIERLRSMHADEWFAFLHDEYFRWKYTAPNRYATTTGILSRKLATSEDLEKLDQIRRRILDGNKSNILPMLEVAIQIPGLGTAGASGLLALIYPGSFGTVDQFVVKALRAVAGLPEQSALMRMKEESLTIRDAEILISIMKRQAETLTTDLGTPWRPRDIDKVLWTYGRS